MKITTRCVIIIITIGIVGGYSEEVTVFMSKYLRRDGGDNNGKDHDIAGLLLMIISAFLLICCAIKVILGPVSAAIQSFCLGVFGIFAYALFAFLFAVGLVLVLRRRIKTTAGIAWSVAGTVLFLFILLQLATTNSLLSLGMGEYLAEVYAAKWTAGGAVFGIIAYALRSMTVPGAYVVTVILMLACIGLLVFSIMRARGLPAVFKSSQRSKPRADLPAASEEKSRVETESLSERVSRNSGVTSLFIENVVGDTPSVYDDGGDKGSLYDDDYSRLDLISKRHITQAQATNILYKSFSDEGEYDPILRGMKRPEDRRSGPVAPGQGYYESAERESQTVQPAQTAPAAEGVHEATVDTHKKPDKIFHESDRANNGFANLTLPTPKTPERENDTGEIINTNAFMRDAASRASFSGFNADGNAAGGYVRGETQDTAESGRETPAFDSFGSGMERFGTSAKANQSGDDARRKNDNAGIVSADSLSEKYSEHIEPSNESGTEEKPRRSGYAAYGGPNVGSFGVTNRNIADNDSPIASEEWFDKAGGVEEVEEKAQPASFYDDREEEREQVFDSFSSAPPIITSHIAEESESNVHSDTADRANESAAEPVMRSQTDERDNADDGIARGSDEGIVSADTYDADDDIVSADSAYGDSDENVSEDDEEPIDLSERRNFGGEDHTGYYTRERDGAPTIVNAARPNLREDADRTSPVTEDEKSAPIAEPEPEKPYVYTAPPIDLFDMPDEDNVVDPEEIDTKTKLIEETLADLRFPAKVCNVIVGPSVTRYELQPPQGIKVRNILSMDMDLELRLASGSIRIEAPVANKQVVGIEVANKHRVSVAFREIIDSPEFRESKGVLPLALGKDIGGEAIVRNLEKMPHLLVAGATNMGKSVCLNTIIVSLIYRSSPEDVRIVLVDPKQIEFTLYRGLPHLLLENPITDVNHAVNALNYLIDEMERRFELFNGMSMQGYAVRNLEEYNKSEPVKTGKMKKIPSIVMVVDELADLMTTRKKDVEGGIRRIAQKARAAGIHLVLATQRPSVDIITGSIKVNLPSRISLKVTSNADSRTVLDQGGAESLIGKGDMLLMCNSEPIRLQGAFLTNEEIVSVVKYVKDHNEARFDKEIENTILVDQSEPEEAAVVTDAEESADEKMYPNIMRCFINMQKASTSLVQTRFALGYARASRIINTMEMRKWIGPSMGAKPREVYMTEAQFETIFGVPFNE